MLKPSPASISNIPTVHHDGLSLLHLKTHRPEARRRWSQETKETVQRCFEATDLNTLCEPHGEDINAMAECETDFMNFYVNDIIPSNKLWITGDLCKRAPQQEKRSRQRRWLWILRGPGGKSNSISIMVEEAEVYKYLRVHLDNRLELWCCL